MVPPAPGSQQPGKKDRREEAREKARIEREAEKRRQRRNKILLQGGIGVAVVAIIVVIALVIVNVNKPASTIAGPTPKNMAGNGILFTGVNGASAPTLTAAPAKTAPVTPAATTDTSIANITTYVDWACPICKQFESTYAASIDQLVASGEATLTVHPISILDRSFLGTRYASRAANAAACVANFEPDKFLDAQTTFYANQPDENTTGLTNTQIKALLAKAGVTSSAVTSCVDSEKFKSWVTSVSSRTSSSSDLAGPSGFGTPTVFVNGKRWNNSDDFATFLQSAVTGTPTPTPTN